MARSASVKVEVNGTATKSIDLGTVTARISKVYSQSLSAGTGNSQIDEMWSDSRSLEAGADETLDLVGALTDALGDTFGPTKIKFVIIIGKTAGQTLTVGAAAANAWEAWCSASATVLVAPTGILVIGAPVAGLTAAGGSADSLKIANSAGSACAYDIIVLGASP